MKTSVSDYVFSPLVWIQIIILFLLLTLLTLVLTPLGPLLGAWAANTFVKELTIEGVSGSLLSRIEVDKVEWNDGNDGNVTTLSKISVAPGRPDFSANLLPIEQLSIESLSMDLAPTTNPRKRGELVDIGDFGTAPINLLIKSGELGQFKVTEAEKTLFQLDHVILDGTEAIDNQFNAFKLIEPAQDGSLIPYQVNNEMWDILATQSFFLYCVFALILSFVATKLLTSIIKRQTIKELDVGESHQVKVVQFFHHENELLLKSSALITIITVLYTSSNELALIATLLLSMYSPIWPYNSLIRQSGIALVKAKIILESGIEEDFVVVTTKKIIQEFTYDPSNPQPMDILLYNKISIVR